MQQRIRILHIISDYLSGIVAWTLFVWFRKTSIEGFFDLNARDLWLDPQFRLGLTLVPIFWIILYALFGFYHQVLRRSRLKELLKTLWVILVGSIILFFLLLLDDQIASYKTYYKSLAALYAVQFLVSYPPRLILATYVVRRVHKRIIGFPTLLIGSNQNAMRLFQEMESMPLGTGTRFVGFLHIENKNGTGHLLKHHLPHLGELSDLKNVIQEKGIEEVIIAIESWEHAYLKRILDELEATPVVVKLIPDEYDILAGSVRMTAIFGAPLIELTHASLEPWERIAKRSLDVLVSILALILLSPVYLITALLVRTGSQGPIFYFHERIGLHGKPFRMYKFRSMVANAELNGPALSSKEDPRITSFGRFMRKVRLDELPQFYNVLIGDMALVGPRPERQYFIDQICRKAPHYKLLHKVKPGITSWGQVKYGYAENVDEMIERLTYDLLYLENMSLLVDLKILIYTVIIVVQGRGK